MKSYIVTTGAAFGLLFLAHVARMIDEGAHIAREPVFLITTIGSAGICAWAIGLFKRLTARGKTTGAGD